MIVTVSTVKDNLSNIERFVRGNLTGGVDHMVVFLDAPDSEVEAWLAAQPAVTTILTDRSWWRGDRPKLLNKRQRINANLARAALSLTDWAEWVFHIDADEVAQIDRSVLASVDPRRPAVNLTPLEVVSRFDPQGPPRLFKRLLDEPDLDLLVTLGALAEPTNSLYFRSHIAGKVGIRPCLDLWLGIHKATDRDDNRLPLVRKPGLEMLHYESYSGAEFVRKWTNMVTSGPRIHFGPHRMRIANALKEIVAKDLDPERKAHYLGEIYRRHMEDPVDLLSDLGLLVEVDPTGGGQAPVVLAAADHERLVAHLERFRGLGKEIFLPEHASADEVASTLRKVVPDAQPRLHRATGWTPPAAAGRIRKGLRQRIGRGSASTA